ncbi:MAG TPA: LytTR family DNA-binding domain-containing protein [Gammaproteobacteria bacterium]|nr:LytTR family DNA-binding domain-containing protein [Gammaproteobacteria bacterium]
MRILIADDEPLARARLRELTNELADNNVIGEAANGKEVLLKTEELQPDLILLDIRMPGMDGLEAARHLALLPTPPAVIFTTAFGDHALAAFETHAVDYLLKPIHPERLAIALLKAKRLTQAQATALQQGSTQRARSHISALMHGRIQLVPVADVIYFRADQKYVSVYFATGSVLIEDSLKTLETEFGERFLRVHRNALVAYRFVTGMEKNAQGQFEICLQGVAERLEISRRHLAAVRKRLKTSVPSIG